MSRNHHGQGHGGHGAAGLGTENVQFTFSSDNSDVTAMTLTRGTRTATVDIGDDRFETTVTTNAAGTAVVSAVERTHEGEHATRTTVFTDADADGQYAAVFAIGVVNGSDSTPLETHTFSFAADGSVTADSESRGDCTRTDTASDSVDFQTVTIDGETYVVKTVALAGSDYGFEISRDDNGDGTWTTIAHGHVDSSAAATYIDDGALAVAGVLDYLAVAASVVG